MNRITKRVDQSNLQMAPLKWLCMQDALSMGLIPARGMSWTIGRCDGECGDRTMVASPDRYATRKTRTPETPPTFIGINIGSGQSVEMALVINQLGVPRAVPEPTLDENGFGSTQLKGEMLG